MNFLLLLSGAAPSAPLSTGSSQLGTSGAILGTIVLGSVSGGVPTLNIDNSLTFSESFTYSVVEKAPFLFSQNLVLTDGFSTGLFTLGFTNLLYLNQSFIGGPSRVFDFDDSLDFIDSFDLGYNLTKVFSDTLIFGEPYINYRFENHLIPIPTFAVVRKDDYVTISSIYGIIYLNPPVFNDTESLLNEVIISRTVSGKKYSYVKKLKRRRLVYEFQFKYTKYLELKNFLDTSSIEWLNLINWKGEKWFVKITNNPIEFIGISNDFYSVTLEFEGYKIVNGDYRCLE